MNSELILGSNGGGYEEGNLDLSVVGSYYERTMGTIVVGGVRKIVYERTIYLGYAPNSTTKNYSSGITPSGVLYMYGTELSADSIMPVPLPTPGGLQYQIAMLMTPLGDNITIETGVNRSADKLIVTIGYYK